MMNAPQQITAAALQLFSSGANVNDDFNTAHASNSQKLPNLMQFIASILSRLITTN